MKQKHFNLCLPNLALAVQFRETVVKDEAFDVQDLGCLRGDKHFRNPEAWKEWYAKLIHPH